MDDLKHEGKCSLDYDTTGKWLVCERSKAHFLNLEKLANKRASMLMLFRAGQLRIGGYAYHQCKEWEKEDADDD